MVMGGRHMHGDVRIVTGVHLGNERIKAWRVRDGHTYPLTTEEALQILRVHLDPQTPACACIGSYPRTPWHDAPDPGCSSIAEERAHREARQKEMWHFRGKSVAGEGETGVKRQPSVGCLKAITDDLNFELACLPNALTTTDELEAAQRLLSRARANVEAVIKLVTQGWEDDAQGD